VPVCDIAVASRATMVDDLEDAIKKISSKAKRVYATFTVDRHFLDPEVVAVVERRPLGFPNYLYAFNLLYQMGYLPSVSYIMTEKHQKAVIDCDAFLASVRWSLGALNDEEIERLKDYYQKNEQRLREKTSLVKKWAFVSWETGLSVKGKV
jgi:hypothetical protein